MDKALLAKIRKCLALGESANVHEAAAALAKARELMDAHDVTEADVALAEIEEATARASRTQRPPRWETILSATVCRALKVTSIISPVGDRIFIGRGAAGEIASYAFAVLYRHLKAARASYIKTRLKRCRPHRKRQRADIFSEAWACAVFEKVARLMPQARSDALVEQYLAERHPGLASVEARQARMKGGGIAGDWLHGRAAGAAVDLHGGVGSSMSAPPVLR